MVKLSSFHFLRNREELAAVPDGKYLINTLNAYSFNMVQHDPEFEAALRGGDYLLPDGYGMVWGGKRLKMPDRPLERVAGWDFFIIEMGKLNEKGGKVMFMGSSEKTLGLVRERCAVDYPNITVETYSPPYKTAFSDEDNAAIIGAINAADPDLLWIGMTAPKQEKWAWAHWKELDIHCHCGTIGAVFDFYAGTLKRAPLSWQKHGFEWLYRILQQPRKQWPRLIRYPLFPYRIYKEKLLKAFGK